jgi:hypothetical protein
MKKTGSKAVSTMLNQTGYRLWAELPTSDSRISHVALTTKENVNVVMNRFNTVAGTPSR